MPGPRGAGPWCQPGCPAPVSDPPGGRGLGAYLTCPARPGGRTRSAGSSGEHRCFWFPPNLPSERPAQPLGSPQNPWDPPDPPVLPGGTTAGAMGSQLEGAMETLINVFHHYSGKEGDKYKLSKKELKELLQSELGCFLETQKDAEVDFQEFVVLVAALTVACNTFFWENA
uniref:Uncharacterized protein n=1 Tax=Geospiza parvula TaxID=87175 RepID=A0A8U8BJL0_GEOPR